jgi:hypothetical protein
MLRESMAREPREREALQPGARKRFKGGAEPRLIDVGSIATAGALGGPHPDKSGVGTTLRPVAALPHQDSNLWLQHARSHLLKWLAPQKRDQSIR